MPANQTHLEGALPVQQLEAAAADGHRWGLEAVIPESPTARLLWLPALGTAERHYLPLAQALAARGVAVFLHEWRGHGSSNLRAGRECSWGYRELLELDLPGSEAVMASTLGAGMTRIMGGHSLGGQLACCRVALHPAAAAQVWLVGSGAPWWRVFPAPVRWWLLIAYRVLPWLARINGKLPGRRIGFGGREARGLITDWARTAMSGLYAAEGMAADLEGALSCASPAIRGVVLADDWYAPESSLNFLLGKMPQANILVTTLDDAALGIAADHFKWMKRPDAVAAALLG
ncbi:alpha/beta fold hydrolase [Lysobacter sp. A03]|uniref:alpha/beta hydrolase family protein n=1 Tax=Lysobacter sp. A03 TaxID=1199154 RepID=UPI0005B6FC59|nr:alpha/beta fold hydrolase [Lysobacter sp. A03]KIQ98272.1 hydrolase of the alpha/beta superfamily [Lysobacter sp. A03]